MGRGEKRMAPRAMSAPSGRDQAKRRHAGWVLRTAGALPKSAQTPAAWPWAAATPGKTTSGAGDAPVYLGKFGISSPDGFAGQSAPGAGIHRSTDFRGQVREFVTLCASCLGGRGRRGGLSKRRLLLLGQGGSALGVRTGKDVTPESLRRALLNEQMAADRRVCW